MGEPPRPAGPQAPDALSALPPELGAGSPRAAAAQRSAAAEGGAGGPPRADSPLRGTGRGAAWLGLPQPSASPEIKVTGRPRQGSSCWGNWPLTPPNPGRAGGRHSVGRAPSMQNKTGSLGAPGPARPARMRSVLWGGAAAVWAIAVVGREGALSRCESPQILFC